VHLGYPDAAHLALRDAMTLAAAGSDPHRVAALRRSLAWLLQTQGRFAEARKLAADTAAALAPAGGTPLSAWSLYGSLLLTGATAAGRAGDRTGAGVLLDEAADVARRTGTRADDEFAFGPDQVLMQTVDVEVVTENYAAALAASREMPARPALPVAARARHLCDVAQAHLRLGHDGPALETLVVVESLAPYWTRYQALPRQLVRELRDRAAHPVRLTDLAYRMGITRK
jgi:hypothetical protein